MTYKETVQYLFNSTPVFEHVGANAYKEGLSNTITLDNYFRHPHKNFRTIHVAGTNGKGSCSHSLAAILQASGYKVGLYTSPHLIDMCERIKVNGECIEQNYVVDFVEQHRNFFEPIHPSFFELTTALAFKYFADKKVDIAVIEVGLGGRLDCTNIITPLLSIITNISFDHTMFLGNTLEKIAGEKAGIIKPNIPVVIGESTDETRHVFISKAKEMNATISFAEDDKEVLSIDNTLDNGKIYSTKSFGTITGELMGDYQDKNTNTVLVATKILMKSWCSKINQESIKEGLSNVCELTGLMGRWQTINKNPKVICDTGHNVGGWNYISKQITKQTCKCRRIVFGMVDDKDIETVMSLLPHDAHYYWTQASSKRAIPAQKVAAMGSEHHLVGETFPTVNEAYNKALSDADKEDFIFIGGSSYVVADFLSELKTNLI